jgi:glycosyltransferase involved in cell wall biosynthesis
VIHNGITPLVFRPGRLREKLGIDEETLLIGTIARASVQKAPEFFIKIAQAFGEQYKAPHRFVFIGDGPLFEDCKKLVASLNLNTVHLLGAYDHASSLLCDLDLFVLWSRWESLPVAIIEAMFAGKPVLATDVGGNYELVTHGQTGYLASGLQLEEILAQLGILANNSQLRQSMGEAGKKRAEANFKLEEMITKYSCLYQSQI